MTEHEIPRPLAPMKPFPWNADALVGISES